MRMLEGKVAVITGAGRGIGRGEALLFAEQGAKVVVNDLGGEWDGTGRDSRPASRVVEEIASMGGDAVAHFEDISEESGAKSLLLTAFENYGRLDAVVNNAGILRDRMVFNMSVEEWDAVIKVHLRGHFLVTREACLHWRELVKVHGEHVRAAVINTSSTSGILGNAGQTNYGAAKAGIAAFSQIVAMEMLRYGVTCNAIAPGARTRMTEMTFGELMAAEGFDDLAPENVAPLVAFLATDAAADITGQVFGIQGGLVELYEGWHPVSALRKEGRWTAPGLPTPIDELFADRPRQYTPPTSPFRQAAGITRGSA